MNLRRNLRLMMLGCLLAHAVTTVWADEVDDLIAARMRERHIAGISIAIIDDGKIVKAQGYGLADRNSGVPVTPATLFQAGSISKSIAAMGSLRLMQEGRLTLDADVNTHLRTWKLPDSEFTKEKKVTLRSILSHTAGLTIHGFRGYSTTQPVPTVVQVLDGVEPANSEAVRVEMVPGSKWRYSGGGYTIVQQMMVDVTGKPFPQWMDGAVLRPLGMTASTYEQPLQNKRAVSAACGYDFKGQAVPGRWHVYPEMAAAGLWTTPSDLARFAIGVQQSLIGHAHPVLSQLTTRLMLTEEQNGDGLGVFLEGKEKTLRFGHGGRDEGFDALMLACAHAGKGAVVMMNANENAQTPKEIIYAIAEKYGWPQLAQPEPKWIGITKLRWSRELNARHMNAPIPGGHILWHWQNAESIATRANDAKNTKSSSRSLPIARQNQCMELILRRGGLRNRRDTSSAFRTHARRVAGEGVSASLAMAGWDATVTPKQKCRGNGDEQERNPEGENPISRNLTGRSDVCVPGPPFCRPRVSL